MITMTEECESVEGNGPQRRICQRRENECEACYMMSMGGNAWLNFIQYTVMRNVNVLTIQSQTRNTQYPVHIKSLPGVRREVFVSISVPKLAKYLSPWGKPNKTI